MSSDKLVTVKQAALTLSLAPQTLRKWCMTGQHLRPIKIGRSVRFRQSDVDRLVQEGARQ